MKINNYKELKVWQKAMKLVVVTYSLAKNFPKEERYGLISQTQRSAVSIPSNIAKGGDRVSGKENQRFLSFAMGSAFELETQMLLAAEFKFITELQSLEFSTQISEVQKMIYGYYESLNQ